MSEPISKTFTQTDLERAANAFIQHHGAGQELEWRWERTGMLNQFIAVLFQQAATPILAGMSETIDLAAPWYREQSKRWQALEQQGWQFETPPARPGMVGIKMGQSIGGAVFYLYAPSHLTFRQIHTSLLEACELASRCSTTPR